MIVTVEASYILLQNSAAIDVAAVFRICITPILGRIRVAQVKDKRDILVRDFLLPHLTLKEVGHHRSRIVNGHVDAKIRTVAILLPEEFILVRHITLCVQLSLVQVVRKRGLGPERHGVRSRHGRQLTQAEVLHGSFNRCQHLQHVGIVEHRAVQQQTLLVSRQFLVRIHRVARSILPVVVSKEACISRVIGHKECFTTCFRHDVLVTQVVNQPNHSSEVLLVFQLVVNTRSKETWALLVQVKVIRTRVRHAAS